MTSPSFPGKPGSRNGAAAAMVVSLRRLLYVILVATGVDAIALMAIFGWTDHVSWQMAAILSYGLGSAVCTGLLGHLWPRPGAHWRPLPLTFVLLLGLCLRGLCLQVGTEELHLGMGWAFAAAAGITMPFVVYGLLRFARTPGGAECWPHWLAYGIAYLVVFRLLGAAGLDLLPEESYYWLYAQHPDLGYLDHPPMVAWLILLGTRLLGHHEYAVRLPALGCWIVTAVFVFRLTGKQFGAEVAWRAVLLLLVLPFFFFTGLVMTPDAPLAACWAGALYFAHGVLVRRSTASWWGLGLCLGLGLLSKYTIALVGLATLAAICLWPGQRHWLRRPQPWLAGLLSVALFAPVIVWNYRHGWASFRFQSAGRLANGIEFSLPQLLGSILLLLTPVLALMALGLLWRKRGRPVPAELAEHWRFARWFTLLPLSVFAVFSLTHAVKLNWTGPGWLALLPWLAAALPPTPLAVPWRFCGPRPWAWNAGLAVLAVAGTVCYLAMGAPGIRIGRHLATYPVAWEEMGRLAEQIESCLEKRSGRALVVVGLDKYNISSSLAFYDRATGNKQHEFSGRHIIGASSLMFGYWQPAQALAGRDVLLLELEPKYLLDTERLGACFKSLGPLSRSVIEKDGRTVATLNWRYGRGYLPPSGR